MESLLNRLDRLEAENKKLKGALESVYEEYKLEKPKHHHREVYYHSDSEVDDSSDSDAESESEDFGQCQAICSKTGKRCRYKASEEHNNYEVCGHHLRAKKFSEKKKPVKSKRRKDTRPMCNGYTKDGYKCRYHAEKGRKYCGKHG
jgi:hypothetical protein